MNKKSCFFYLQIILNLFLLTSCSSQSLPFLPTPYPTSIPLPTATFYPTATPRIFKTYQEILNQGIKPFLKPSYKFPVSAQYRNGCFAFAVNHILQYKYKISLDPYEVEEVIEKPREDLWTADHVRNFLTQYNINMKWYKDAETFFTFLQQGEPIVVQYKLDLGNDKWVGHLVAAYSFDEKGIWISDSLSGKRKRLDFNELFDQEGKFLQYGFATVEKEV